MSQCAQQKVQRKESRPSLNVKDRFILARKRNGEEDLDGAEEIEPLFWPILNRSLLIDC